MMTYEVYVRPFAFSSKRNLAMIYANRQYAEKCAKEYQEKVILPRLKNIITTYN